MFHSDTVKVFIGFLLLCFFQATVADDIAKDDIKRTKPEKIQESIAADATEERPQVYQEHYEDVHHHPVEREEKEDRESYPEPQRISLPDDEKYTHERNDNYGDSNVKEPHAYKFGYEVKDNHQGHQFRHERKDEKGNIHGRFGYRDPKGQYRQVNYVADDHGFRANVQTNEPGIVDEDPADVDIEKAEEIEDQDHHGADASGPGHTYEDGESPSVEHHPRKAVMEHEPESYRYYSEKGKDHVHMHYDSQSHQPYSTDDQRVNRYKPAKSRLLKSMPSPMVYRRYFKVKKPHEEHYAPGDRYEHSSQPDVPMYQHIRKVNKIKSETPKHSTYQYEVGPQSHGTEYEKNK